MKRKPVENIIYEIIQNVKERFFAENPIKKFPEDFLDEQTKKGLKEHIRYPKILAGNSGDTILNSCGVGIPDPPLVTKTPVKLRDHKNAGERKE